MFKIGQKALLGNKLVVILTIGQLRAFVKMIGKGSSGETRNVAVGDLKPFIRKSSSVVQKAPTFGEICPDCGLGFPNYRNGIECPSCGYRDGFKRQLKHIIQNSKKLTSDMI